MELASLAAISKIVQYGAMGLLAAMGYISFFITRRDLLIERDKKDEVSAKLYVLSSEMIRTEEQSAQVLAANTRAIERFDRGSR